MKKLVVVLVAFLFAGCLDGRPRVISGLEGKPLPQFTLLLTDSISKLSAENIPAGQPFVLFYFSPFCPYCRAQTEELTDDIKSFEKVRFYFISGYALHQIKKFEDHYKLPKYKIITTAQVKDSSFSKYYKISGVPYIAVYNKDKILKEVLLGKVSTSDIRKAALEN